MQAVKREADKESQQTVRQGLTNLTLQLLQHLTALWAPQALHDPALQLLRDPGSAQLMPSTESVAPPRAMLAAQSRQQRSNSNSEASNAEEAVLDLLKVLHACQVTTWQQLPREGAATAAGAGLAVLYSCCISQEGPVVLETPADPVEALQVSKGCQHTQLKEGHTMAGSNTQHSERIEAAVSVTPGLLAVHMSTMVMQSFWTYLFQPHEPRPQHHAVCLHQLTLALVCWSYWHACSCRWRAKAAALSWRHLTTMHWQS
jgi:hypothetical protein